MSVFLLHSNASTLRGKTMEKKHHELRSKKRAAQAIRQTVRATRIIPAFSSSRFLAASALCCRIRAKRSARSILSESTKYLKKKNCSSKVSNKLINYKQENKPSALKDHEGGKSYEQVKSRKQGMKPIYEKILIEKTKRGNKYKNLLNINK